MKELEADSNSCVAAIRSSTTMLNRWVPGSILGYGCWLSSNVCHQRHWLFTVCCAGFKTCRAVSHNSSRNCWHVTKSCSSADEIIAAAVTDVVQSILAGLTKFVIKTILCQHAVLALSNFAFGTSDSNGASKAVDAKPQYLLVIYVVLLKHRCPSKPNLSSLGLLDRVHTATNKCSS